MSRAHFFLLLPVLLLCQYSAIGKPITRYTADSLRKAQAAHRRLEADSLRSMADPEVFTLEHADSLLMRIEHLHTVLNDITNQSRYGYKTEQIEDELKDMQAGIQVISTSVSRDSTVLNLSNLDMFRGLLKDMEHKLLGWRTILYDDNKEMSAMSEEMKAFSHDSLGRKVAADTAFANLHLDEILVIKDRWHEAKKLVNENLTRIARIQASVSTSYFTVTELENKVGNELAASGHKTLGKEYNYIWNSHNPPSGVSDAAALTLQSYGERMKIMAYYLRLNVKDWLSIMLIGLVYFIWVFRNFRRMHTHTKPEERKDLIFEYIRPIPILSTIIFTLSIAPFYGFDQPGIYVEALELLVLVPLTFLFWRVWTRQLFVYWCILCALCIVTSGVNAIITPGWPLRLLLLAFDVISIIFGLAFLRAYDTKLTLGKTVRVVIIAYIVLNILSVVANIVGRLTLAKVMTTSGVIGVTQMIGFSVLIPIMIEAFYLQMRSSRVTGGMTPKFNYEDIRKGLFSLLSTAAIFLWLITFATNLDIYGFIVSILDMVLNTQHKVGSTAFSIGNVLTFVFILYIVSILQKYVGYFFGETEDDFVSDLDKKESRLVIFRLVIIMVGFFIAVVASGLPVDKVTVVLGALGVGIGLGLQNIVYNLISGVVLIFEKPMQIGDYIEVADKKGRVQNIGIRSSKLVTSDGSEVIVPNGDILSSHMVNWTRSNNNRRAQLSLEIEPASELQLAKEIILAELKNSPYVIQDRHVDILIKTLSEKSAELTINVWISSIYKEEAFKSEILSTIYARLAEKDIKII
jgi:small-conductance mechanosensitive channel